MKLKSAFAEFIGETEPTTKRKKKPTHQAEQFALNVDTTNAVRVPNIQPRINPGQCRIALIGEAPGEREVDALQPFVGPSGYLLNTKLSQVGIVRDQCFIGNVCQIRPPGNNIALFSPDGAQIREGLEKLTCDLQVFNPHICVLLGKTALYAANGQSAITDWRGSIFIGERQGPFFGRKCIASLHPAACLRQYEWTPLLLMDLKKALRQATTPNWEPPLRDLRVDMDYGQLLSALEDVLLNPNHYSLDIEGYVNNLPCLSIAKNRFYSFIVPFHDLQGNSLWDLEQEVQITKRLATILASHEVRKIWQNGLYDRFVLSYGHGFVVNGNEDDTMLRFWEQYCELEKGLGFQASVLTEEPHYKFERKADDRDTFFRYCCKDSAITFEINERLATMLGPGQHEHYRRNHDLLNPLLYMELRGIRYDTKLAKDRLKEVTSHYHSFQAKLDECTGHGLPTTDKQLLMAKVREVMCYKRDQTKPKKDFEKDYDLCMRLLLGPANLTPSEQSRISIALDTSLNIKSAKFKSYLYETLKLPVQYKKDQKTGEMRPSTDYEALLRLSKKTTHPSVQLALEIGVLRTRSQMLEIHADNDGRVRCGYNVVGTETGRLTCYTSPTGSGYNLQTIPAENTLLNTDHPLRQGMRDLFVADEGHYLFQCDLSGADGWTIGAYLASLGDNTMLEDLLAGLKPAQVICYILRHGNSSLVGKDRTEIKVLLKTIEKDSWDYTACKMGIWGTCYSMGPRKLSTVLLIQSEGRLDWSEQKTKEFQEAVLTRYRVRLWHDYAQRQIKKEPVLVAPNGFRRRFFGRPNEILGEYLACMPQVVTTHMTNTAMFNLWTDPENRLLKDRLRVEPLHSIHDALMGQFKIDDVEWSLGKLRKWFNNSIIIAGQRITIPFSGTYGKDWAFDNKSKVGDI